MLYDIGRNDQGSEPFRMDFPECMRTLALAPALDVHVADSCNLRIITRNALQAVRQLVPPLGQTDWVANNEERL